MSDSDSSAQPNKVGVSSPSSPSLSSSSASNHTKRRKRRQRSKKRSAKQEEDKNKTESNSDHVISDNAERKTVTKHVKNKRSRKKRSRSKGSRTELRSAEMRLKRAVELIDSVAREEAAELGVMRLTTLHLNLMIGEGETVSESPHPNTVTRQVDKLQRQINGQVRALVPTQFQRGTVYCFHQYQGITPPKVDSIFTGYDPLGRPLWTSFLPLCLNAQIPNID